MRSELVWILAVLPAISFAQQAPPLDGPGAATLKRVERRLVATERQSRQTTDALQNLTREAKQTSARLSEAQVEIGAKSARMDAFADKQQVTENRVSALADTSDRRFDALSATLSTRSMIFEGLLAAMLVLLSALYWLRQRGTAKVNSDLSARVEHAIDSVRLSEERNVRSDTALADSLFEILGKLNAVGIAAETKATSPALDPDHSLPIKLADEIHRMRKRLMSLPEETKGLTPLKKSLERLVGELEAHGYEAVDQTGTAYSENLSVKARFIPSDELAPDERVISKVVAPQVNHKGVMVRMADVEVSIG